MPVSIQSFDRQKYKFELAQLANAQKNKDIQEVKFLLQRRARRIEAIEAQMQPIDEADIAAVTSNYLQTKTEDYFQQMLEWKPLLDVGRFDDVRIIQKLPHLGYASIVWGETPDKEGNLFPWILYYCNFNAQFGTSDTFFENILPGSGTKFFGLALSLNEDGTVQGRNKSIRGNGLLFATSDPEEAFENVSRLCDMKRLRAAITRLSNLPETSRALGGEVKSASG